VLDGENVGNVNPYEVQITADHSLTAIFGPTYYVGTNTVYGDVSFATPQGKIGYYGGYCFAFYCDGTDFVYKTSSNGISWSNAKTAVTDVVPQVACRFSVFFDGNHVYMAFSRGWSSGMSMQFKRGTISGETINWGTEYTVENVSLVYQPVVTCDSGGLPFILWFKNDWLGHDAIGRFSRCSTADGSGTWTNVDVTTKAGGLSILQMSNGQVYLIYFRYETWLYDSGPGWWAYFTAFRPYGRLWNGTSLGSEEVIYSDVYEGQGEDLYDTILMYSSATVDKDDTIHFVFKNDIWTTALRYHKRVNGTWQPREDLESIDGAPAIGVYDWNNKYLAVFYSNGGIPYYKTYTTQWNSAIQLDRFFIYPESRGSENCFVREYDGKFGISWAVVSRDHGECYFRILFDLFPGEPVTFNVQSLPSNTQGVVLSVDSVEYHYGDLPYALIGGVGSSHTFQWMSPVVDSLGNSYGWVSTTGLATTQSGGLVLDQGGGTVTATYQLLTLVRTDAASQITNDSATLNGALTSGTCDQRGFDWGAQPGAYSGEWTEAGSFGQGSFSHSISATGGVTYYFRAKAHISSGWFYGDEKSFNSEWWLEGFAYRQSHVIQPSAGAGTDYQVRITVHYGSGTSSGQDAYLNSHSRTDFGDVRFIGSGYVTLNYWIESYSIGDVATFWVKIAEDLSSTARTIYIYYGKSDATTTSNVWNTFLAYDNFDDNAINATIWATHVQNGGSIAETGGEMQHVNDGDWSGENHYTATNVFSKSSSYYIQFKIRYPSCYANGGDSHYVALFNTASVAWSDDYYDQPYVSGVYAASIDVGSGGWTYDTTWKLIIYSSGTYDLVRISGTSYMLNVFGGTIANWANLASTYAIDFGSATYGSHHTYWDNTLIRKYANPEPAHGAWGSEESQWLVADSLGVGSSGSTLSFNYGGAFTLGTLNGDLFQSNVTGVLAEVSGKPLVYGRDENEHYNKQPLIWRANQEAHTI
jgi:hypothetical protein